MKGNQYKKKRKWRPKFGPNEPKFGAKLEFFCQFLKVGSLVFIEIASNDSLQQFVTMLQNSQQQQQQKGRVQIWTK